MNFALVDLNLYLDMYPDNAQAVEDYNALFKQYWEARSVYEQANGPLMNFGHCPVNYPFNWVASPWPWERAANYGGIEYVGIRKKVRISGVYQI